MGDIWKESKVCCVSWSDQGAGKCFERSRNLRTGGGGGGEGTPVLSDMDDRMGAKIIIIIIIIIINY